MPIKKTVSERRAARAARKSANQNALPGASDAGMIPPSSIPHEAITDSPAPPVTADMAGGDEPVVRGNSNRQPMNAQGHATAQKVGAQLASLGGPDEIDPSSAVRTVQTAQEVSQQTGAPIGQPNPGLESHALGQLEGDSKTPEVKKFIADMVRKAPNMKIPGMGAMSNRPSESMNEFRIRALSTVRGLIQKFASNPSARILVPTSTQVIRLVKAWTAKGCPDDLSIDVNAFLKDEGGKPGDLDRFFPGPDGKWELTPFKPQTANQFQPGIYFMRHGETDSVQAQHATESQKSRAQIISHVRAGNWKGVHDTAKAALAKGHLGEQDISDAVDEGLPTAQDANRLNPAQFINALSAAGPTKKAELRQTPIFQHVMDSLPTLPPDAQHALRSHLGRIA